MLWLGGIAFTCLIAGFGSSLSLIPGLNRLGPLACAIIIAAVYRQFFGYPEVIRSGIQFSAHHFLRFAIVLYGLKLNITVILNQGLVLLVKDIVVITIAILVMVWIGKLLKADPMISLLLGVGTGVCGAAAIAAMSPIMKARQEDTAISVGMIALVGTLFSIIYTILFPFLPISSLQFGEWSGISLHEIAQVALAGASAGSDALAIALLAKLGRVLLLVPLSFLFLYVWNKKNTDDANQTKISFPWFLIGFIIMSLFGSFVLGKSIPISPNMVSHISIFTSFILTAAMVGLGLNISFYDIRTKALRPFIALLITSVILSFLAFWLV
ncbi:putative sulfate exporter family transporter [Shimazuella sp. AN120528]|nr:putative sulfate exporter family transporter [Shimazuella soli]MCH5584410.1 putative sulfate exporter family transporter [Shimazuella soli]